MNWITSQLIGLHIIPRTRTGQFYRCEQARKRYASLPSFSVLLCSVLMLFCTNATLTTMTLHPFSLVAVVWEVNTSMMWKNKWSVRTRLWLMFLVSPRCVFCLDWCLILDREVVTAAFCPCFTLIRSRTIVLQLCFFWSTFQGASLDRNA